MLPIKHGKVDYKISNISLEEIAAKQTKHDTGDGGYFRPFVEGLTKRNRRKKSFPFQLVDIISVNGENLKGESFTKTENRNAIIRVDLKKLKNFSAPLGFFSSDGEAQELYILFDSEQNALFIRIWRD